MEETVNGGEVRERAKKRVEEIKGFYVHLGVYLIVNAGLFAIDMLTSPGTTWFYWPLLGWGIGMAIHAFAFFTEGRLLGPEWEERKVQEIVQREELRARKSA